MSDHAGLRSRAVRDAGRTMAGKDDRGTRRTVRLPLQAATEIAGTVAARHGNEHLGAAWLHAHDATSGRTDPRSGVLAATVQALVEGYDHAAFHDQDADATIFDDSDLRPGWTPFHDAQLKQNRTLVSRSLSRLRARDEFVLRHVYGLGMEGVSCTEGGTIRDDAAFTGDAVGRRLDLTGNMIQVNLGDAVRRCSGAQGSTHRQPAGLGLRAAMDQYHDVDVEDVCTKRRADFRVSIRHDHALTIRQREDREAKHVLRTFPELARMERGMPDVRPSDRLRRMVGDWKATSFLAEISADSSETAQRHGFAYRNRIRGEWKRRRDGEHMISHHVRIVGASKEISIRVVPAAHPGRVRRHRIVAYMRGRTSEEFGIRIPEGEPIDGDGWFSRGLPYETLMAVQKGLIEFAQAVIAAEKADHLRSEGGDDAR